MLNLCAQFISTHPKPTHPFQEPLQGNQSHTTNTKAKKAAIDAFSFPEAMEMVSFPPSHKPLKNQLKFKFPFRKKPSKDNASEINKRLQTLNCWLKHNECKDSYEDLQVMREANRTLTKLEKKLSPKQRESQKETIASIHETVSTQMSKLLQSPFIKKACCLEKLFAIKEGCNSRNHNITIHQMLSLLQNHVDFEPNKLREISVALCRQINMMMEDKDKYKGKNLQLKAKGKEYTFHSLDTKISSKLFLDFFCWLEVENDGSGVELFIALPEREKLGQGTNKDVSEGLSFYIPFQVDPTPSKIEGIHPNDSRVLSFTRKGNFTPKALIEPRISKKHRRTQSKQCIDTEILAQQNLKNILPPSAKFVAPIEKIKPLVPGTEGSTFYTQKRYHSDLEKAINLRKIRLDFSKEPVMQKIKARDFLKIISDVGVMLEDLHHVGYIHHDVKPMNILIEVQDDKKNMLGILGDFDLTETPRINFLYPRHENYFYWDTLTNYGFATPFGDIYGLTMCLAFSIIPGLNEINLKKFLTKDGKDEYYLNILKNFLPHNKEIPTNLNNEDLINWYERGIEKTLRSELCPQKEIFLKRVIKIRAIKGVIDLLADVVQMDKKIESSYSITPKPVVKFISEGRDLNSLENQDLCLASEIDGIEESVFETHVKSQIKGWGGLSDSRKIVESKLVISAALNDDSLDPTIKEKLEEILIAINARESALEFMGKLYANKDLDLKKHPLYAALTLPTILTSEKTVQDTIKTEVSHIKISSELEGLIKSNQACIREACTFQEILKIKLSDIMYNSVNSIIRSEAFQLLNQVTMIVRAMDLAVEMRNYYKKTFAELMGKGMTIQTFNQRLKEIRESLEIS